MQPTAQEIYALWQRYHNPSANQDQRLAHWTADVQLLNQYGVSVDELMGFLFFQPRSVQEFAHWFRARMVFAGTEQLQTPVLNETDLLFWQQNGYVVLHHAVSDEDCDAAAAAIWQYLQADPQNPASWYTAHEGRRGMMLQLFNHPALQRNRMSARIRKAYEQLYGHHAIQVTIDKVSFNTPETGSNKFAGTPLHWDVSLVPPVPYNLQGLLYLHDVSQEQGAFQCVPGFQLKIDEWLRSLPPGADPRKLAAETGRPVTIPGKKGDLIIWHNALPHCATPNRGTMPRLVQYITWYEQRRVLSEEWK
ncbi:MAG: phytanoyl-CoA dioxygenase family protein [Bacteroidetes bacterium]|nr:phytanoyl-CoA dioxygenase family protein [Bacteroidota bacterium]